MQETEKFLRDYSDQEKGAYLGAIASIATADHSASEDELEHIMQLADSAGISQEQKEAVRQSATELSGDELLRCLDILKTSELRFSLVTDLINFGESDKNYSEDEKNNVEKIATYLKINPEQFSLLKQFVNKTAEIEVNPEEVSKPGFLSSLGLDEKFKKAGIDWKTFGKGLLGIAGPMLLAKMLTGRNRNNSNPLARSGMGSGGGIGSLLSGSGGGLGSLISALSGGRGYSNSGGLLSKIIKGFKG